MFVDEIRDEFEKCLGQPQIPGSQFFFGYNPIHQDLLGLVLKSKFFYGNFLDRFPPQFAGCQDFRPKLFRSNTLRHPLDNRNPLTL